MAILWRKSLVFAALILGFLTLWQVPARADVLRTGITGIASPLSGKCLDIAGQSIVPGAQVLEYHCDNAASQQWTLAPYGGAYRVIDQNSGQCMNVNAGSLLQGAFVVQDACQGTPNELWSLRPVGFYYELAAQHSGFCLAIQNSSVLELAPLIQVKCNTTAKRQWFSFASGLFPAASTLTLQANHSGQCLNVSGGNVNPGTPIVQWPCQGATNEQWTLTAAGSYYQVKVPFSGGQCLVVSGGSTAPGAPTVQSTCTGAANEMWQLIPTGGSYQLVSQNSGMCLDVYGASQTYATPVVQNPCALVGDEQWSLTAANLPAVWSSKVTMPLVPAAIANLPNGNILTWSSNNEFSFEGDVGNSPSQTYTSTFNPKTLVSTEVLVTNTGDDMFCPGTAVLPDGRVLVNGGSSSPRTSLYSPSTGTWASTGNMNLPRGYEADTVLPNGQVFTLGGSWSGGQGGKSAELWSPSTGTWQVLSGVPEDAMVGPDPAGIYRGDNHAWFFPVSGGYIFHAGPSAKMNWINPNGSGSITPAGNRADDTYAINGKAIMYDVNKIMKTGGAPAYQDTNATTNSYLIDLSSGYGVNPAVTKIAPMEYPRAFGNGAVLPNGQVVLVGGQTYPVPFTDSTAILIPELWDPVTRIFHPMAPMTTPRTYHSTALLLPDGRVFVAGGGLCGNGCVENHNDAEILSPPYLFNPDGTAAVRPVIIAAPTTAALGTNINVNTNTATVSFALIRLSATTHTVNNDERRIPLSIVTAPNAYKHTLALPSDSGVALPGNYMLFAMDANGVPSVARTIRIF